MIVSLEKEKLKITFSYKPQLVDLVKSLPGRTWNKELKCWFIPLEGSENSLKLLATAGFAIGDDVWVAVSAEQAVNADLLAISGGKTGLIPKLPLYDFQKVGAAFMIKSKACLNAYSVGLGKTVMTLEALAQLNVVSVLFVVPKSMPRVVVGSHIRIASNATGTRP